jgi:uncharacterized protein YdiU (UPF0061 family)
MVRFSRSHIRFGTFERLEYLGRKDLIAKLLNHVITLYYPQVATQTNDTQEKYGLFYQALVQRVAELAAQWVSVGFCHGVLNTDNMSITGESFDYGPYAFMEAYDPRFTAAYFDYFGLYCFGNQPSVCQKNLLRLQRPLGLVMDQASLEAGLATFEQHFHRAYAQRMLNRLGFATVEASLGRELLKLTLQLLQETQVSYQDFFARLRQQFSGQWREDMNQIPPTLWCPDDTDPAMVFLPVWQEWRDRYHFLLNRLSQDNITQVQQRLQRHNPLTSLIRPQIEAVWAPIVQEDNWQPFYDLLDKIRTLA